MYRIIASCLGLSVAVSYVMATQTVSSARYSNLSVVSASPLLTWRNSRLRGARFRVRASGWRRGGYSRGCPEPDLFAAVTPPFTPASDAENDDSPGYFTASSHPTLFISVPAMPTVSGRLFFENIGASDRSERQLYKVDFELDAQSGGVIGIQIPDEAPPLTVGQDYLWRVSISCDAEDPTDFVVFRSNGLLEVVEDIDGTTEERLNYYLDEQIWQDTLTMVAEAYYANPDSADAIANWEDLTDGNGLSQYAAMSIVEIVEGELQ